MKKKLVFCCLCLWVAGSLYAQHTINGLFPPLAGGKIYLKGFKGQNTYIIDSAEVGAKGDFLLRFAAPDYGLGYLSEQDNKPFFVILTDENIQVQGVLPANPESATVLQGRQNQLLQQYANEYPRRDNALAAWIYLERIYKSDSLFSKQKSSLLAIQNEKQQLNKAENDFLKSLDAKSFLSWYLPKRKLASAVYGIAQNRYEEVPATIQSFRQLDYTDPRWYKSDLYTDIVEKHFWLLENSGGGLDSVYKKMQLSIDLLVENLSKDEKKLNEVGDFLFNLLEKRSLFTASEYLALKLLNQNRCTLNDNLAKNLETYRSMKKGNIAPDIAFSAKITAPRYSPDKMPKSLYSMSADYKLVVFGASWCSACTKDLPALAAYYDKFKQYNIETIFVSLDGTESSFAEFAGKLPFVSICDLQGWESDAAKAYFVSGTPTMFLLNKNNKIMLRPNSPEHVNAWIDWYVIKGNAIPE